MKAQRGRALAVRALELLCGLVIAHLGVTLFLLSDLGSDPFNVLIQGLHSAIPWPALLDTHGRVHLLVSLLIMLVLLLAARGFVKIGTVICMALGGPIIDLWSLLLSAPLGSLPLGGRIVLLVAGCVILAFGMTIVISSDLGAGPNDLVAVSISDIFKKPFGVVRVCVDVCFALAGWLLGGVLGAGTVVCAFLVGPVAQLCFPLSRKLCSAALARSGIEPESDTVTENT